MCAPAQALSIAGTFHGWSLVVYGTDRPAQASDPVHGSHAHDTVRHRSRHSVDESAHDDSAPIAAQQRASMSSRFLPSLSITILALLVFVFY